MSKSELSSKHCAPCNGQVPRLTGEQVAEFHQQLDEQWQLGESDKALRRKFVVKGYAKAVYLANLCAWLADREGHHPDVTFGFGYCTVRLTTHDAGGLTENDFIWASRLDVLTR